MLNQLKAVLSDASLRQQLQGVSSLDDAIALFKTAGAEVAPGRLAHLLQRQTDAFQLSEAELLSVAGGAPTNQECDPTAYATLCVC